MLYVYRRTLLFLNKMKSVSAFVIGCFIGCCVSSGGVRRLTKDDEKIRKLKSLLQTELKDEMNRQNLGEGWKTRRKEPYKKMMPLELERGDAIANQNENKSRRNKQKRSTTEFNITDPYWPLQWHLQPDQKPSMGVYEAWQKGYTGKGIVVGLISAGIDTTHSDLIESYNASLSYDFINNTDGGSYLFDYDSHGTRAAGVIAASKNDQCIIGIAYEATIASFRTSTIDTGVTDAAIVRAFTEYNNEVDIYHNAYGQGLEYGGDYYPTTELERLAILQAITEGRNGKGSILVYGAGFDGELFDDCNTVEMYNSMYGITVNPMDPDGRPTTYAEECTSIMVATYGGQDYGNGTKIYLASTNIDNTCIPNHGGTAAAVSVASGILALTLQANPNLTWRDVQYLIVETSTFHDIPEAYFTVNGAGKNVSVSYGFGVMNADHLVEIAPSWKTVPTRLACTSGTLQVDKCCSRTVETSYVLEDCLIQYLEQVQVHVLCQTEWREHTEIHVVSPQGTDSRILRQRKFDHDAGKIDWTFMSVHYWGENPSGNWSIRMDDFLNCGNEMHLYSWTLSVYGTITNPLEGIPNNGTLGGYCDDIILCTDGTDCLLDSNICVNCTLPRHRIFDSFCVKDGYGYCDTTIPCRDEHAWCNAGNVCETCATGYREINGICEQDGMLGGYCNDSILCEESDVGCDSTTNICINCTDGYHIVGGLCKEDGTLGGYCGRDKSCDVSGSGCYTESGLCIDCSMTGYRMVAGYCMQDGMIDGYCDSETPCVSFAAGCLPGYNKCAICYAGYTIVDGYCIEDDAPETQAVEAKSNANADTVAGIAIAGFATGVLINGVVFIVVLQKTLLAKKG